MGVAIGHRSEFRQSELDQLGCSLDRSVGGGAKQSGDVGSGGTGA